MNAESNVKPNIGYAEVPYSNLRGRSFFGAICKSIVELFGREENGCTWGYSTFKDKLNISRATVYRHVKALRTDEAFKIERVGEKSSELRYVGEFCKKKHLRVLYWFFTEELYFEFSNEKTCKTWTEERCLKPSEIKLLALVYTRFREGKNVEGTYHKLASMLNMEVETLCRAVRALLACDLIEQKKKAKNGTENIIGLNKKEFKECAKLHKKRIEKSDVGTQKAESPQKIQEKKRIEDANARADRERYYALLRERAEERAAFYLDKARENARFKDVDRKLNVMELALAKAEIGELSKLPALKEEQKRLRIERVHILTEMGMTLDMITPQYVCKKCSDTGFLEGGKACDCYKPPRGEP